MKNYEELISKYVKSSDIILKRISNIVWHIDTNRWIGDSVTLDEVHKSLKSILSDFDIKGK